MNSRSFLLPKKICRQKSYERNNRQSLPMCTTFLRDVYLTKSRKSSKNYQSSQSPKRKHRCFQLRTGAYAPGSVKTILQYGLTAPCCIFHARFTFCAGPAPPRAENICQMCIRQQNAVNSLRFDRIVCLPLKRLSSRNRKS